MWPPDELWSRIAAVWSHAHGSPGGEQANAIVALRQLQQQFDLSDAQVAFIAEYQILDPSSRIVRRERVENAFEVVLGVLDGVGLVMPFEHLVLDTAWILHSYLFHQFLHTPRWLIWSRGSGFGKSARLSCIHKMCQENANTRSYAVCMAYLRGLFDGMQQAKIVEDTKNTFCPPQTPDLDQIRLIIEQWVRDNTKNAGVSVGWAGPLALSLAFPCR